MEHQQSGLVWGLDNWIYTTYNAYRLRWAGEKTKPSIERTFPSGGQWGLTQDDYGKIWVSNAGGEKGLYNFQTPPLYGAINVDEQKSDLFDVVWPIVAIGDFQGGPKRFHAPDDKRLNHFTGCGGQTVYRGDRLPQELYGNIFLPEAVGRLIRRAVIGNEGGVTTLKNPYEEEKTEFIRSSDPYFRPVNMTTGPDGCLYIVDAYRGIIQEGNWVREGSFLRDVVEPTGMQDVVGHGRIWRLVHKDFKPGPHPEMLSETAVELVAHLAHPNGWWRDTAQKMLVVKNDKSVVPALAEMAANHNNHLARLHAIWTLEGIDAATPELVRGAMKDENPHIRVAGIQIAERLVKMGDESLIADIKALRNDEDPAVVLQTNYTGSYLKLSDWKENIQEVLLKSPVLGIKEIGAQLLVEIPNYKGHFTGKQIKQLEAGREIYQSVCFACHGADGKGTPIEGRSGETLAPPLSGSRTVLEGDAILRVLMNGLSGPIDGKTYESQMMAMGTNSDEWMANVSSYIRNSFGNKGELLSSKDVRGLRKELKDRTEPWTIEELRGIQKSHGK